MESKYLLCLQNEIEWNLLLICLIGFVCEMWSIHKNTLSLAVCWINKQMLNVNRTESNSVCNHIRIRVISKADDCIAVWLEYDWRENQRWIKAYLTIFSIIFSTWTDGFFQNFISNIPIGFSQLGSFNSMATQSSNNFSRSGKVALYIYMVSTLIDKIKALLANEHVGFPQLSQK